MDRASRQHSLVNKCKDNAQSGLFQMYFISSGFVWTTLPSGYWNKVLEKPSRLESACTCSRISHQLPFLDSGTEVGPYDLMLHEVKVWHLFRLSLCPVANKERFILEQ